MQKLWISLFIRRDMEKKKGHAIVVTETYKVFVEDAQNFEQAKEVWDELALDSERCSVVKYYEDDVYDA